MPTVSNGVFCWLFRRSATLEDFADRLNHIWTFGLLILLACIISWKQGVNKPIVCWCPAQFVQFHVDYAESTCWNSHHIVYHRDIAKAYEEIENQLKPELGSYSSVYIYAARNQAFNSLLEIISTKVTLYQWLPLLLCFQALLFKLPNILMYILHGLSGISFDKISGLTDGYRNLTVTERGQLGKQTGRYIYNWCRKFENCLPWRFLTLLWLMIKFLYCINIIAQMCLTDSFLRTTDPPVDNSTSYGEVIMDNLFENNATLWKQSPVFPRQILCSFEIEQLSNVHSFTTQCDLPMNEYNEVIYMFVWVWMLFVSIVTCLSLVSWLSVTMIPIFRKRYILNVLSLADDIDTKAIPQLELDKFGDLIGEDGVMALKLISANSSEHMVRDVVSTMWRLRAADRFVPRNQVPSTHVPEIRIHDLPQTAPPAVHAKGQPLRPL